MAEFGEQVYRGIHAGRRAGGERAQSALERVDAFVESAGLAQQCGEVMFGIHAGGHRTQRERRRKSGAQARFSGGKVPEHH